ncbi:MAG: hypothetical protein CMP36_02145 [Rickettsiales bacterium]|nr:hypothetical protein [Rickettsiales bacterium]OUV80981.1 MAG: hypothetical protein CBC91_02680 [Rickettsiales bacterium TMED131]
MKTSFLKKNINNIKLSSSNSSLSFYASKESFLDKNLLTIKDVFAEIYNVGKKEYGLKSKEFYASLKKKNSNELLSLDNGIVLVHSFFNELKKNCLMFFRLQNPVVFDGKNSTDIIFTLITPENIETSNKLQILAKLTRILKSPNIRKEIRGAKRAEDVLAILLLPSL